MSLYDWFSSKFGTRTPTISTPEPTLEASSPSVKHIAFGVPGPAQYFCSWDSINYLAEDWDPHTYYKKFMQQYRNRADLAGPIDTMVDYLSEMDWIYVPEGNEKERAIYSAKWQRFKRRTQGWRSR